MRIYNTCLVTSRVGSSWLSRGPTISLWANDRFDVIVTAAGVESTQPPACFSPAIPPVVRTRVHMYASPFSYNPHSHDDAWPLFRRNLKSYSLQGMTSRVATFGVEKTWITGWRACWELKASRQLHSLQDPSTPALWGWGGRVGELENIVTS